MMNKETTQNPNKYKEQIDKYWKGKERLFYCKNKDVGMNKPHEKDKSK